MSDDQPIYLNGERMVRIEDDGHYSCINAFVEDVDYDWFSSVDGSCILIPEGCEPPVVFCGKDASSSKICGCFGKSGCEDFIQVDYGIPEEASADE